MASVTTVGHTVPDGLRWRDEVECVVARFARYGVLASFGHVALDAQTTGTIRRMMRVIGECLFGRTMAHFRSVARQAERVVIG